MHRVTPLANMTEPKHLPDITVRVNHHVEDIRNLIQEVRPAWTTDQLQIESLSGGYLNQMYHVYIASEPRAQGLVVRVFNAELEEMLDRGKELTGLYLAYGVGHGTPVYAVFNNGMVLGFCVGRNLTHQDFIDQEFNKHIAVAIARLNHTEPKAIKNVAGHKNTMSKDDLVMKTNRNILVKQPPETRLKADKEFPSNEELVKEYDILIAFLESLDIPVVFCHNDIHVRNVMYNEENQSIVFVDFELASYNYIFGDICRFFHFKQYGYMTGFSTKQESDSPVDEVLIRQFLRSYLETKAELEGRSKVTEDDVTEFTYLMEIGQLVFDFELFAFCVSLPTEGLDNVSLASKAMERYYSSKHKLQQLGKDYLELKKEH